MIKLREDVCLAVKSEDKMKNAVFFFIKFQIVLVLIDDVKIIYLAKGEYYFLHFFFIFLDLKIFFFIFLYTNHGIF